MLVATPPLLLEAAVDDDAPELEATPEEEPPPELPPDALLEESPPELEPELMGSPELPAFGGVHPVTAAASTTPRHALFMFIRTVIPPAVPGPHF